MEQTITSKSYIVGGNQKATSKADIKANISRTVNVNAYIGPPQAFIDEVGSVMRKIEVKIEMMWDGISWTDESDYFISATANEQESGDEGEGVASTLDVELDNTSGRFTPGNPNSLIYTYLNPRVPIRISLIMSEYEYRLFTGYIKNIHPNMIGCVCSLECYDNQVFVSNKLANSIVYEDFRSDQLLEQLSIQAGMSLDQYQFDEGVHTINYGYFSSRNVWPLMGDIAAAERGRVFFDRNGLLKFWNRYRMHNKSSIFTLTLEDWITDLDYSVAEHEIKNYVRVRAKPRASAGIQVVWTNGNIEMLNPYSDTLVMIPAGGMQNAWLELEDPCSTFIKPVPNTDYTASTSQYGTGEDLTNNISVTEFINYGNAVFLTVVNNGDKNAYLNKFQVRGNPIRVLRWIQIVAQNDTSISTYGKQDYEIDNDFIQNEYDAIAIAYEALWRKQDSINLFRINTIGVPYLMCGDVISIEYLPGLYKDYMIDAITWTLDGDGFNQELTMVNPYTFPEVAMIDAKARIGMFRTRTVTSKAYIS